jgi:hypothetical protein
VLWLAMVVSYAIGKPNTSPESITPLLGIVIFSIWFAVRNTIIPPGRIKSLDPKMYGFLFGSRAENAARDAMERRAVLRKRQEREEEAEERRLADVTGKSPPPHE